MNKYLVTIMVTVSGYEKVSYQLVQAETMWGAEMVAIKAEAHNEVDLTVSGVGRRHLLLHLPRHCGAD